MPMIIVAMVSTEPLASDCLNENMRLKGESILFHV